jgi:hypothetical protein
VYLKDFDLLLESASGSKDVFARLHILVIVVVAVEGNKGYEKTHSSLKYKYDGSGEGRAGGEIKM